VTAFLNKSLCSGSNCVLVASNTDMLKKSKLKSIRLKFIWL